MWHIVCCVIFAASFYYWRQMLYVLKLTIQDSLPWTMGEVHTKETLFGPEQFSNICEVQSESKQSKFLLIYQFDYCPSITLKLKICKQWALAICFGYIKFNIKIPFAHKFSSSLDLLPELPTITGWLLIDIKVMEFYLG